MFNKMIWICNNILILRKPTNTIKLVIIYIYLPFSILALIMWICQAGAIEEIKKLYASLSLHWYMLNHSAFC